MSLAMFRLGRNIQKNFLVDNVPNASFLDIPANPNRVGILISMGAELETGQEVMLTTGADEPILLFAPSQLTIYMGLDRFGVLVQGAMKVNNYTGDYFSFQAIEFTVEDGMLNLTDEAIP